MIVVLLLVGAVVLVPVAVRGLMWIEDRRAAPGPFCGRRGCEDNQPHTHGASR